MSVWFKSYIAYGVKIPYKKFEEVAGEKIWEDDSLRMENNEHGLGWAVDGMNGGYALLGLLVHDGTGNGNDDPLGGNGEAEELKFPNEEMIQATLQLIENTLGAEYLTQAKYYVVGEYS